MISGASEVGSHLLQFCALTAARVQVEWLAWLDLRVLEVMGGGDYEEIDIYTRWCPLVS
jgi:hypothetical protein